MDKQIVLGTTLEEEIDAIDRICSKMKKVLRNGGSIEDEVLNCLIENEIKLDEELNETMIDYEIRVEDELDAAMVDYDAAIDEELGEVCAEIPTDAEEILRGIVQQ